jgi:hypothetical protein
MLTPAEPGQHTQAIEMVSGFTQHIFIYDHRSIRSQYCDTFSRMPCCYCGGFLPGHTQHIISGLFLIDAGLVDIRRLAKIGHANLLK